MKTRLLIVLACLGLALSLSAQIQKGDISLQGAIGTGYQWSANDNMEGLTWQIGPSAAWMLSDHWLIGAAIGGNVNPADDVGSDGFIGPFARYYFNPAATGNNYFVGTSANLAFGDVSSFDATLALGFNRFIAANLSLETTIGYTFGEDNFRTNGLSAGFGFRSFLSGDDWRARKGAAGNLRQGGWLVGTSSAGFVWTGDAINIGISPNVGYFLTDRLVLGLDGGVNFWQNNRSSVTTMRSTTLSAQPFVRYYWPGNGQRLMPFGQFGVGYATTQFESEGFFDVSSNRLSTHARLGANLFLAPNVAFELSLDLRRSFNSNVEYIYHPEGFPNGAPDDFNGTLEDRQMELGVNLGLQFFLFRD